MTLIKHIVVVNTSPIIYLSSINSLSLLKELFYEIFIIMDDRLGRKIARLRGFTVIGTLRLLVIAKGKGIITEVKPLLNKLKEAGFWVSDSVYKDILMQSNEIK